jgi:hypothetical protein
VSRKAKLRSEQSSPIGSPGSSRAGSRATSGAGSRTGSHQGSDDEDSEDEDDDFGNVEGDLFTKLDAVNEQLLQEGGSDALDERIEAMLERKGTSVQSREENYMVYGAILRNHYCQDKLEGRSGEIIASIMKSVKNDSSERESVYALKALILTIITDPEVDQFDLVKYSLKRAISDSESMLVKTTALRALGIATFFGGANDKDTEEILHFLEEIVDSEGKYVSADHDSHVITASLQEWGFLASSLPDDILEHLADSMSTFVPIIDTSSHHPSIQISAGEDVALMYEKSYERMHPHSNPSSRSTSPSRDASKEHAVQLFTPYHDHEELIEKFTTIANSSSKRVAKKDRRMLKTAFSDFVSSLQNPGHGPSYSTALRAEDGSEYGSRLKIGTGNGNEKRTVDTWAVYLRYKSLKRSLAGGWATHMKENYVIEEAVFGAGADDD